MVFASILFDTWNSRRMCYPRDSSNVELRQIVHEQNSIHLNLDLQTFSTRRCFLEKEKCIIASNFSYSLGYFVWIKIVKENENF